ncbi:hypothetical protein GCM10009677_36760 [Sphaerisporangium rubeum]|uniref:Uncharacterized protein n=1 Tax=Sphaerisporangium rubeum TaxID=321317 RepID=A0A7X0IEG6_9ACTN|nr:hypothetical protein [Sphaerisporangium rubeum]MBB6473545.1 hypothetical protein [Sphaerisporangium rubeum]
MGKLTEDERGDLTAILSSPELNDPRVHADREVGQQLADFLRKDMPDVDEVVLGRVLLRAAVTITQLGDRGMPLERIANIFTLSAVDLTALELARGTGPDADRRGE